MVKIYATVGDFMKDFLNPKTGEMEPRTVEGPKVIQGIDIHSDFAQRYAAIKTLWPQCTIRFEKEVKP